MGPTVVANLGMAAEADASRQFRPLQLPDMAIAKPVIGFLELIAVVDQLAKHAVFVADAVAGHRQLQRCAAIDETGGETAETAVAQTGINLDIGQFFQVQTQGLQRLVGFVIDAQVEHCIAERPSHEKFKREVIGPLAAGLPIRLQCVFPAPHQAVPHTQGHGRVRVMGGLARTVPTQRVIEMMANILGQILGFHAGSRCLRERFLGLAFDEWTGRHVCVSLS